MVYQSIQRQIKQDKSILMGFTLFEKKPATTGYYLKESSIKVKMLYNIDYQLHQLHGYFFFIIQNEFFSQNAIFL